MSKIYADNIRIIRKALNLNQLDFAKKLGLTSPAAVSGWESGNREPDISTLIKIAEIGNVTVEWLMMGDKNSGTAFKQTIPDNLTVMETEMKYGYPVVSIPGLKIKADVKERAIAAIQQQIDEINSAMEQLRDKKQKLEYSIWFIKEQIETEE